MSKPFHGLRTAISRVSNIEQAKKWYTKITGIEPYFDESFYVGFNIGGYELGLQPDDVPKEEKVDSAIPFWGVDDVEATYKMLLESGATGHEPPEEVGGGIVVAAVKDPWGNPIGIIYNPHFKVE